MKLLALLFSKKTEKPKTIADYKREKLISFGKQQFQKMMEFGVSAPVQLAQNVNNRIISNEFIQGKNEGNWG